jgi:hypothetical protein
MGEVSSQACHHLHAAGLETREARTWSLPVLVSDLRLFDARSVQAETCHRPSPTRWASQRCAAKLATVKRQAARSGRNTHTRASERTASHRNSSQGKRHNERARATKIDYSIRVVLPCTLQALAVLRLYFARQSMMGRLQVLPKNYYARLPCFL